MKDKKIFFTIGELSAMLKVQKKTIYDWVQKEKIPYYKFEGSLRFASDEITSWTKSKRHPERGRAGVL